MWTLQGHCLVHCLVERLELPHPGVSLRPFCRPWSICPTAQQWSSLELRSSLSGRPLCFTTMPYEDTNIPNSTATKCQMKQHGKCSGKWHGFPWVSVFVAERVHLRILCQLHRWPVSLALKFHRWIWSMYRWISSIYMRTTMEFRSNKDWIQIYFYF
jgi:hypothetical protein